MQIPQKYKYGNTLCFFEQETRRPRAHDMVAGGLILNTHLCCTPGQVLTTEYVVQLLVDGVRRAVCHVLLCRLSSMV